MTSWRMDLTVLTDLSASMFAACFMILLVFLALAQRQDAAPEPSLAAIEAAGALRIVRQEPLTPEAMVELLRGHGAAAAGTGLDLFEDRVEIALPGRADRIALASAEIGERLAGALRPAGGGPVRLYVFSNAHYNPAVAALDRAGLRRVELTVPRALRDGARPQQAWSPAFLALGARGLDAAAFRRELAALLAGSAEEGGAAPSAADGGADAPAPAGPPRTASDLLERLRRWLAAFAAIVFPAAGLAAVAWIERRRFGAGRRNAVR